jgi:hypothetical protein
MLSLHAPSVLVVFGRQRHESALQLILYLESLTRKGSQVFGQFVLGVESLRGLFVGTRLVAGIGIQTQHARDLKNYIGLIHVICIRLAEESCFHRA